MLLRQTMITSFSCSRASKITSILSAFRPSNRATRSDTAVFAGGEIDGISPVKIGIGLGRNPKPPSISKPDQAFLNDGVEFVWNSAEVNIDELNDLFVKVGFPLRDPLRLRQALDNTHTTLWIRATKTTRWAKQNQLLGFARATSDGVLTATIWDVAVNPSWQRVGLGRALVERLVGALCEVGIPFITLYAEPDVVGLYEKLGFVKDSPDIKGMAFITKTGAGRELIRVTAAAASTATA